MDEILENIKSRRSCRNFLSTPVKKEDVEKIIEAGLYAASGKGKQATITLAVSNKELRDYISKINRKIGGWEDEKFDPFYNAPTILVVLAKKDVFTNVYDGSLVLGNMMLEANALGLASIWIHRAKEEFEMQEFKTLLKELGVNEEYIGVGHLAIGYSAVEKPVAPKRNEGRVYYLD